MTELFKVLCNFSTTEIRPVPHMLEICGCVTPSCCPAAMSGACPAWIEWWGSLGTWLGTAFLTAVLSRAMGGWQIGGGGGGPGNLVGAGLVRDWMLNLFPDTVMGKDMGGGPEGLAGPALPLMNL